MFCQEEAYLKDNFSASLETEALQTDIQRFIAILGFCLMAVFALVQSIPVTEPNLDGALAGLEQELVSQREQVKELISENRRLKMERDGVKETLEKVLAAQTADTVKSTAGGDGAVGGPYVAFESDRVFMSLLKSGKIHLFINIEGMKRGFRVLNGSKGIQFAPMVPGSGLDLWEIEANTVPSEILGSFAAWTTLSSNKKMFIVGLTSPISRPIRTVGKKDGRFLIKAGGKVVYTP